MKREKHISFFRVSDHYTNFVSSDKRSPALKQVHKPIANLHEPVISKVNPSTSITTIPSDPTSTKISLDKTTISKSRDLEITRQPLISSLRSTLPKSVPISIPSKRTIADRTPPFVPVDMSRKTIGSLKLNKDSDVTSTSNITAPHLDLTQDLNFGLSTAPKASPLTTWLKEKIRCKEIPGRVLVLREIQI
ncbi:hypothetical protein G6F53_012486 [Rhizopus delemar]|nr:hypothetical protein G6F53_012486 [Rhizopus delemar]